MAKTRVDVILGTWQPVVERAAGGECRIVLATLLSLCGSLVEVKYIRATKQLESWFASIVEIYFSNNIHHTKKNNCT